MREDAKDLPSWGGFRVQALMREHQEAVGRLAPHARLTRHLQEAVAHVRSMMAVPHEARSLELQRLLTLVQALLPPRPRRLIMDEFAPFKGTATAASFLMRIPGMCFGWERAAAGSRADTYSGR
jgi:hypothetical protein